MSQTKTIDSYFWVVIVTHTLLHTNLCLNFKANMVACFKNFVLRVWCNRVHRSLYPLIRDVENMVITYLDSLREDLDSYCQILHAEIY